MGRTAAAASAVAVDAILIKTNSVSNVNTVRPNSVKMSVQ